MHPPSITRERFRPQSLACGCEYPPYLYMSTLTIQLPESLKKSIEAVAAKEGYTVSQFMASAAGEKLAVMMTMDYLRRESEDGRRDDFDRYLAAASDIEPTPEDQID